MSDPNPPAADQPGTPGTGQPGPYSQPSTPEPGPGGYAQPGPAAGPSGYGQPAGYGQAGVSDSDERLWATLGHAGGIVIGFVAGLIVYLVYKDRSAYLKEQGAEALNFQITIAIGYVVSSVLAVVGIGFVLWAVVWIAQIVFGILAAVATNKHQNYRYPFAIRLVK